MRIATYNIWNCEENNELRFAQITDELVKINADIIALQEVPNKNYFDILLKNTKYEYGVFHSHCGEDEGLSVISKYPIVRSTYSNSAVIAVVNIKGCALSITNVHLDWLSPIKRENDITALVDTIAVENADYKLLLGDFNCSEHSSVHQFLLGQSSLRCKEAVPCWYDLSESYFGLCGKEPEITLDFKNNPRWRNQNTVEKNQRFDRILLQNTYPNNFPVLRNCVVFGKEASAETGLAPSDHYGVFVDIDF